MKIRTFFMSCLLVVGALILKAQQSTQTSDADIYHYSFIDTANRKHSLKEFQGRYVYLDVWASWCGPCKKEYPFLEAMISKLDTAKVKVVSLSIDHQLKNIPIPSWRWIGALNGYNMKGTQWCVTDTVFEHALNIDRVPRFILLNPDGSVNVMDCSRPSDPATLAKLNNLTIK